MPFDAKTEPLLKVENLRAWYGDSQALHDVSFDVAQGELVTLIGRNGAGKSTTLRSIMGIVRNRRGSILFEGQELMGKRTYQIARKGIAWCPEERGIFADLSVRENLTLPPILKPGGMSDATLLETFPNLKARATSRGTQLSGGEQQMLAIARILRNGLLVEQNLNFARSVADRHVVIENGAVVDTLTNDELAVDLDRVKTYLGV